MKKRLKFILPVVLLVGAGVFFAKRKIEGESPTGGLRLFGNVDIRQVDLGFRVAGRIEAMSFEEGDEVKKGEPLAMLDRGPFEDDLALAEAQLGVAEAQLAKLEAGTRPAEIAQARAVVEERKSALKNAEQALTRQRELAATGAVSKQTLDDAQAQHDAAAARLNAAEEALSLSVEGPRAEDIVAARAEVRTAEARVAQAKRQLEDTELLSPSDGVILTRVEEPGGITPIGATVYTLSLKSPVWVRTYVSEPDLGRVHPGLKVAIQTDSRPDQAYVGQVGFISPVAEFTPKSVETVDLRSDLVYRVRVIVADPDDSLRQGMPVTLTVPEITEPTSND